VSTQFIVSRAMCSLELGMLAIFQTARARHSGLVCAPCRRTVDGSVVSPHGARVVWLRDPDSNLLSVVEYASRA
jgi:hypothetical protein